MSKYIAVVFPNEAKAFEATRALKDLHANGDITVYGMSVIATDGDSKLEVKQSADDGPLGVGVSALVGGLVGTLGGPIGTALGASAGSMIGGMEALYNSGAGADFAKAVANRLGPNKSALVAEIEEEWVTPLDTRMEALGGLVVREFRSDFEDLQMQKDLQRRKAEMTQLKAEMTNVRDDRKASLQARITEAQAKLNTVAERAKARIQQIQQEAQAKTKALQAQAANAKGDAKAKIEQQIGDLRRAYDVQADLLLKV